MKVFIVTDLEGVSGATQGHYGSRISPELLARQLALMMGEINAVVEGCVRAGVEEILVGEAHPIDLAALHPEAKLVRGIPWHEAIQLRRFDAALFVGQHARTGLDKAVRSHTGSGSITGFWINDRPMGELGYVAGLAGHFNTPVVFLSGDSAACEEARELIPGQIVTVAVEESHCMQGAVCLPPAKAHPLLTAGVVEALPRRDRIAPLRFPPPVTFRIEYRHSQIADEHAVIPGVKREGPRTVSYTAGNYYDAYLGGLAVLRSVLYKYDAT